MSEADGTPDTGGSAAFTAWPPTRRTLGVAAWVSVLVTAASHVLPSAYANLGVAAAFLGATWLLVLRHDTARIRAYGLSLGGFFEPEPFATRRALDSMASAILWTTALALLFFPPFVVAYQKVWAPTRHFVPHVPADWFDRVSGQLVVVALPEEAFFRGYLQSALDGRTTKRFRLFDAELGPGWLASAAIFAVGHVLTVPQPGRLAVFFPALVFGWLRARTGGIGAGLLFHAACNLLSTTLALGFGLAAH